MTKTEFFCATGGKGKGGGREKKTQSKVRFIAAEVVKGKRKEKRKKKKKNTLMCSFTEVRVLPSVWAGGGKKGGGKKKGGKGEKRAHLSCQWWKLAWSNPMRKRRRRKKGREERALCMLSIFPVMMFVGCGLKGKGKEKGGGGKEGGGRGGEGVTCDRSCGIAHE